MFNLNYFLLQICYSCYHYLICQSSTKSQCLYDSPGFLTVTDNLPRQKKVAKRTKYSELDEQILAAARQNGLTSTRSDEQKGMIQQLAKQLGKTEDNIKVVQLYIPNHPNVIICCKIIMFLSFPEIKGKWTKPSAVHHG